MVSVSAVNPIQWFNTVACVTGWSFGLKNPASIILTASVFGTQPHVESGLLCCAIITIVFVTRCCSRSALCVLSVLKEINLPFIDCNLPTNCLLYLHKPSD